MPEFMEKIYFLKIQYEIIEKCSWGPFLELFARGKRKNWTVWGNEANFYSINWKTYKFNSSTK